MESKPIPTLICNWCGKPGHLISSCPERKPSPTKLLSPTPSPTLKVSIGEIANVKGVMSGWERNKKWREANREKYNAGMREYRKRG